MNQAALDHLLVVSLEQAVAAPYCSRIFAENGARVIKLERPEGDFARAYDTVIHGDSAYFVWLNGGKESLAVDLAEEADKALLRRLLSQADVFIQNLRPGAVDRLGFGFDTLHELNPRLVMCSISGYGLSGAYADMKAYDALIQAETGLCSVTGPEGQPSKVGASICDIATGLTAYGEIMKSLYARDLGKGTGTHVEVSLFGTLAEWMAVPLAYYEYGNKLLKGTGMNHAQICPYGAYKTADGLIFLVVQNHNEWLRLCREGLERPDLADHALFANNMLRVENSEALRVEIEQAFAALPRAEVAKKLQQAGIACGSINDITDLGRHPALERRTVRAPGGESSLIRRVGGGEATPVVPALDEHGARIRAEFGQG